MPPKFLTAIRIEDEQIARIDAIAAEEGRVRADVIRRLIQEALDARADGHPRDTPKMPAPNP